MFLENGNCPFICEVPNTQPQNTRVDFSYLTHLLMVCIGWKIDLSERESYDQASRSCWLGVHRVTIRQSSQSPFDGEVSLRTSLMCSRIYVFLGNMYAAVSLWLLTGQRKFAEHLLVYLSGGRHVESRKVKRTMKKLERRNLRIL